MAEPILVTPLPSPLQPNIYVQVDDLTKKVLRVFRDFIPDPEFNVELLTNPPYPENWCCLTPCSPDAADWYWNATSAEFQLTQPE